MPKRHSVSLLLWVLLLPQLAGCSLYLTRPITFSVLDAETKQPIAGANVEARYSVVLDFGLIIAGRGPLEGVTECDGKVTLHADPHHDALFIKASATGYQEEQLSRDRIEKGLRPRKGHPWGNEFVLEMYAEPQAKLDLKFPRDYRGVVVLRFSPVDTSPPIRGQREFSYVVPANGIVDVKESGLIKREPNYDGVRAFVDGKELLTLVDTGAGTGKMGPDLRDAVALRFVGRIWEHSMWVYVLGTGREGENAEKMLWPNSRDLDERALKSLIGSR
ncbi:MAG: hypothetical protein HY040_15385 [Planctomycetes bacterium]|nr:hypothetical protein [Planctomycetota bacterium]